MKKYLIAGNWKMNTNPSSARSLAVELLNAIRDLDFPNNIDILVCPPFTNLALVYETIKGSRIKLGSQNCYFEPSGAFTGEISLDMLKECGCEYTIIGHSERREIFGETDELINKKLHSALEAGLTPILCIGETLAQRQNEETIMVLEKQLNNCLKNVTDADIPRIVIAYEPIWAIGTGVSASTLQVKQTHSWIKDNMLRRFRVNRDDVLLLYGGSMNASNCGEILAIEDVNGGLIGGASLKAESFVSIFKQAFNN